MRRSKPHVAVPVGIVGVLSVVVLSVVFVVGRSVAQESPSTSATSGSTSTSGASGSGTSTTPQQTASTPTKSSSVTRGDLTETLSTNGTLRAATTWLISHQSDQMVTSAGATSGAGGATGAVAAAGLIAAAEGDPPTDTNSPAPPSDTAAPAAPSDTAAPAAPSDTAAPAAPTGPSAGTAPGGPQSGSAVSRSVSSPKSFILTSIASSGSRIDFGGTLYTADDVPTIVLPGTVAAYRTLKVGVADGADVQQLEAALLAAGFDAGTVDAHFDTSTKAAVTQWQESIGLTGTGVVLLGDVVFSPTPLVVESTSLATGASISDGTEVLTVRSTDIVAEIAVTDALSPHLHVGDKMQARLPDRSAVPVTISVIVSDPSNGRIAMTTFDNAPAITVTPVSLTLSLTVPMASNALIIDPLAIIHLEGGVDAVRLDSGELVPVTILATTGSKTAVTSDKLTTTSKLMTS